MDRFCIGECEKRRYRSHGFLRALRTGRANPGEGLIVSTINVPGFTRSMMDGFALRADETHGATPYNSLLFQVIGTSFPGRTFEGVVRPGTAVRIMTGAPMPDGADAVLPVEFTEWTANTLTAMAEVSVGKNVGAIGEDVAEGSVLLKAGRVLRPQDAGVLSSIGCSSVPVVRKPFVRNSDHR